MVVEGSANHSHCAPKMQYSQYNVSTNRQQHNGSIVTESCGGPVEVDLRNWSNVCIARGLPLYSHVLHGCH